MNQLQAKFRGCLQGALVGDCLGAVFEGDNTVSKVLLNKFFAGLPDSNKKGIKLPYSDDTAMTRSLVTSLIQKNTFDVKDCAQRFQQEYFNAPKRGYGGHIIDVFMKWRKHPDMDVLQPAREQFGGKGSFGNGAAMRVAPVALFCYNDVDKCKKLAEESALLTHTNKNAYNGAILQCLAVMQALQMDFGTTLEPSFFIDQLISQMRSIESDSTSNESSYCSQLAKARILLAKKDVLDEVVVETLGNDVSALGSVPTAVFSFLHALDDLKRIDSKGHFARTIHYAISLGGDTDTIATMAGAIAGAYLGEDAIPEVLLKICEGLDVAIQQSDMIYELSQNRK